MIRTQVQLPEEQMVFLKDYSRQNKISISEVVRQSVNSFIHTRIPAPDSRKKALNLIGKFKSGKPDLSRNHDAYFLETLS